MNKIYYNIASGGSPFEVELIGSNIPKEKIFSYGQHFIDDVPNGSYTLMIKDAYGWEYTQEVLVNASVTTTTTTKLVGDLITVGNTQDQVSVFDINGTNRDTKYSGYPDPNVVKLYLWFKTKDGKPLESSKYLSFYFEIGGNGTVDIITLSDNTNAELSGLNGDSGTVIFNAGFIETYLEYNLYLDSNDPNYSIDLRNVFPIFDTSINTKEDDGKLYGVDSVASNQITFIY